MTTDGVGASGSIGTGSSSANSKSEIQNPFGGFVHTSPLAAISHNSFQDLSSNCVRDYFGPTVQTVSDCLLAHGPSALAQIIANVKAGCSKVFNEERGRLIDGINKDGSCVVRANRGDGDENGWGIDRAKTLGREGGGGKVHMNRARGLESSGFVTEAATVRAALIVMMHHSLVTASAPSASGKGGSSSSSNAGGEKTHYTYTFHPEKARLLMRYPRYVEHAKWVAAAMGGGEGVGGSTDGQGDVKGEGNGADGGGGGGGDTGADAAAHVVESLLVNGRMRGEDVVTSVYDAMRRHQQGNNDGGDDKCDVEKEINEVAPESDTKKKPSVKFEGDDDDELRDTVDENGIKADADVPTSSALKQKKSLTPAEANKRYSLLRIIRSFKMLVESGYVEAVKPIAPPGSKKKDDNGEDGGEVEFDSEAGEFVGKKRRRGKRIKGEDGEDNDSDKKFKIDHGGGDFGEDEDEDEDVGNGTPDDPDIVVLLSSPRTRIGPPGSVYRVNILMFHHSLRSARLGRLVREMYDGTVDHAGAVVEAALAFAARQEHAPSSLSGPDETEEERHDRVAEWGTFCPPDLVPYLSSEATTVLRAKVGGIRQNLSTTLVEMSRLRYPPIVVEVEDAAGHPNGGKFEVCSRQLVKLLRGRIQHLIIRDRHSVVAARITAILRIRGYLESEAVAEDAMVPPKDAREVLHRLHRDGIVDMFGMHLTKVHNSATAIYLWNVQPARIEKAIADQACAALMNVRLRRQHEVEVGKDWIERAKEAGASDENTHELDREEYMRFCRGLERLDHACLQLDETLMVLKDF